MRTDFSKPSSDVDVESTNWIDQDDEILDRQSFRLKTLNVVSRRNGCLLCGASLVDSPRLTHRSVVYFSCRRCEHLQTEEIVKEITGVPFEDIYPLIDQADWQSRCERIYTPKLEWILKCLADIGITREEALTLGWLEVGAGAGYFLGALLSAGAKNITGIDANSQLAGRANQILGSSLVECTDKIGEAIIASRSRFIVSFFVLEHLVDPTSLIDALSTKPSGTIFAFAVPTYGFASLLEGVFDKHAARSLDSIVHRQLYTDRSIDYLLERIGYRPIARWVFGQDALDLQRLLVKGLRKTCDPELSTGIEMRLANLIEPLQHTIDTALMSDARHVLAVKK